MDLVRRGCEARRLFAGNNSHSCVGGLGKQLPKLPGALVRVISERQWPRNGFPSDAFSLNAHSIYAHSRTLAHRLYRLYRSIDLDCRSGTTAGDKVRFCKNYSIDQDGFEHIDAERAEAIAEGHIVTGPLRPTGIPFMINSKGVVTQIKPGGRVTH